MMHLDTWLELVDGKPSEYSYDDILHGKLPVPTPQHFLHLLFLEICDTRFEPCVETEKILTDYRNDYGGYCGTREIGWYWHHIATPGETEDFLEELRSNNLPGIEFIWKCNWRKLGQAGYAGYRHRFLKVKFTKEESKAKFETVWQQYFGVAPQFKSDPDNNMGNE